VKSCGHDYIYLFVNHGTSSPINIADDVTLPEN